MDANFGVAQRIFDGLSYLEGIGEGEREKKMTISKREYQDVITFPICGRGREERKGEKKNTSSFFEVQ